MDGMQGSKISRSNNSRSSNLKTLFVSIMATQQTAVRFSSLILFFLSSLATSSPTFYDFLPALLTFQSADSR